MNRQIAWPHPGEILLHDWLEPMGISQYALAKAIDVPPRRINEIVIRPCAWPRFLVRTRKAG